MKKNKGYSLIEILIYLAIFTAMSILVINSFIIILSSFNTTNSNRKILESGLKSMERISREIRKADSIDIANTTSTNLQLINNAGVAKISSENNDLNLYLNNNLEGNLLDPNIDITNLVFRRITTAKSEAVKIEMTLLDTKSKNMKSGNFYNTIILRGGY